MQGNLTTKHLAVVGQFDLERNGEFKPLGQTAAWNWQMGCQLQWLEGSDRPQIIYNKRNHKMDAVYPGYAARICDVESGEERNLPLPVYVVAPSSEYALCVNYSRLRLTHSTIGYVDPGPAPQHALAPADDGIYRMDLESGEAQLIVNLAQLGRFQPEKSMQDAIHWVTHLEINPSSSRFLFLHRWTQRIADETCWLHRLFTVNPDGTDLCLLESSEHELPQLQAGFDPNAVGTYDYEKSEYQISHPTWRDDTHVMVWGPHAGGIHYHLYQDRCSSVQVVGADCFSENGHMTYSPDRQWILTDTYPDDQSFERTLILYHVASDTRFNIGRFYADPKIKKDNRCDLHPRWSRNGLSVCIDSVHETERQLYVLDVAAVIGEKT